MLHAFLSVLIIIRAVNVFVVVNSSDTRGNGPVVTAGTPRNAHADTAVAFVSVIVKLTGTGVAAKIKLRSHLDR